MYVLNLKWKSLGFVFYSGRGGERSGDNVLQLTIKWKCKRHPHVQVMIPNIGNFGVHFARKLPKLDGIKTQILK